MGKIPEVYVLWWNNTVPVPERPRQLKLLEPSDLDFIWNGDRIPKLIRKIDHWECDEPEIIQDAIKRAKTCKEISEVNSSDEIIEVYRSFALTKRTKNADDIQSEYEIFVVRRSLPKEKSYKTSE